MYDRVLWVISKPCLIHLLVMMQSGVCHFNIRRYYDTCRVHCLNLELADIYMLTERRYPLPADVCQAMLDKKLQGDKRDEAFYQLLKLIENYDGAEKDCLSVDFATTQQMVISSPCLTNIKNWLVQSKRLCSASTLVSTGRRVSTDHNLWDVIVNEDFEEEPALTTGETSVPPAPKIAKQLAARRNQERVKKHLAFSNT
ncbi:hypothetical protein Tco_1492240 [Tanacetum coccineum]